MKKLYRWFIYLAFLVAWTPMACSSQSEGEKKEQSVPQAPATAEVDQKLLEPSNGTKEELKTLVKGNNEFAVELYSRLSRRHGNIIFSPYSLSTALTMAYAGARGETAQEMAKALKITLEQDRLHEAVGSLAAEIDQSKAAKYIDISIANSLWVQNNLKIGGQFLRISRKNYQAGMRQVDFANRSEESRQIINDWAAMQTKDKIKGLLQKDDIDRRTVLILVNAIYFQANWLVPFSKERTTLSDFEVSTNDKPLVPMMHHESVSLRYHGDESFEWLELPYADRQHTMVVLLPRKKGQLSKLEESLSVSTLQNGISGLRAGEGTVALPIFKFESHFQLKPVLATLGMPLVFSTKADFGNITDGVSISNVIQKAMINVEETGTVAAAASGVVVGALAKRVPLRFTFNANHPFFFLIRDTKTGTIFFMGRVSDPR